MFNGLVVGGSGSNTLELATGSAQGRLTAFSGEFVNFGTLAIDAGANWVLSGRAVVGSGVVLSDSGTFSNAGTIDTTATVVGTGNFSNTGIVNAGSAAYGVTLLAAGTVTNVALGAVIEGSTYGGGTLVEEVACFCPGTRIATPDGERPVEALRDGDLVLTLDGSAQPVRWIGRRAYDGRFVADNHLMLPVTIQAGALAQGVPHTDLVVSPGHAMWLNGQLVPAWRLINGVTITQAAAVEEVHYLHVELHRHAILLANGAPAESFLEDKGFRGQFGNAAEFYAAYPDAEPLAPLQARLEDGFALQCILDRLTKRAGLIPAIAPAGPLRGCLDEAGRDRVCGWAQDADGPEEPVVLEVLVDGAPC